MTRRTVGDATRSDKQERVRFVRALLFSLLLHASALLLLKAGPPPGKGTSLAGTGGVIEATLRPAAPESATTPSLPEPPPTQPEVPQPSLTAVLAAPAAPSSVAASPAVQPPPSAQPSASAAPANLRSEGLDLAGGAGAGGESPVAIPVLPPLPVERGLTRRPSLLAPVSFSYPANIGVQGGRVRVRILLDSKGKVEDMRVMHAVPPGVFDQAALAALRLARYAPGFVGPNALRSYLYMEVTFGPGPQGQQVWYAGDAIAPIAY